MRIPAYLLRQTATLERYEGSGAYGPIYGEPTEVRCRIEPKRRLVRDREGNEVIAEAVAFFAPDVELPPESRLIWEGRRYTVIESRPQPGPTGKPHHVEVTLG